MSVYRFPAIANPPDCVKKQLDKIGEELAEVREAYERMIRAKRSHGEDSEEYKEARMQYGIEHLDVIQSDETALRMEFAEDEVEEFRAKVIEKNANRSYYRSAD